MIRIAERWISVSTIRVDMSERDGKIYVDEMTVYSYSGLQPFQPDSADFALDLIGIRAPDDYGRSRLAYKETWNASIDALRR